jgi:hypothetical protein
MALPNLGMGQAFTADQWRVLARWRLGGRVYASDSTCSACNKPMPICGNHAVECGVRGDLIRRHNSICAVVADMATQGGLAPIREMRGLIPGNQEKPADVYIDGFDGGRNLVIDVSVISPMQSSLVTSAAHTQLYAAQQRVDRKHAKYDAQLPPTAHLVVAAVETYGGWHPEAKKVFKRLAEIVAGRNNTRWQAELKNFYVRLAMALMRANANAFLSRRNDV